MKKNKGFTLIELLAVIIILGIIALIAVPTVFGIISESRKQAFKDSAYGISKAMDFYYMTTISKTTNITDKTFTIKDKKYVGEELPTNSSLPEDGTLYISKEGETSFALHQGDWCAIKTASESEVRIIDYDEETCVLGPSVLLIDKLLKDATDETLMDYSQTYGELSQNSVYAERYATLIAEKDLNEKIEDKSYFENKKFYVGENPNNYIYFNGKRYRIVSIDSQGVKVVGLYNSDTDTKAYSSSNTLLVNQGAKFLGQTEFISYNAGFGYSNQSITVDTFINNLSDKYINGQTGEYYEKTSDSGALVSVIDYYYSNKLNYEQSDLDTFSSWMSGYAPFIMNEIIDYEASNWLGSTYLNKEGKISAKNNGWKISDHTTVAEYDVKKEWGLFYPVYVEYYISPSTLYLSGDGTYSDPYQYVNEVVVDNSIYIYNPGDTVGFNPVSNAGCSTPISDTGTKTGCMKWHVLEDDGTNLKVILDHNTTASTSNPDTQLTSDTQGWDASLQASLPTAQEIAAVVGVPFIYSTSNYIYLDDWLYNRTSSCIEYGCEVQDSSVKGYLTSTINPEYTNYRWVVTNFGSLSAYWSNSEYGIRPVITISKGRLPY